MSDNKADPFLKKLIRLYKNYGLDISNMSEEEVERIRDRYDRTESSLDIDLKKSEKYSNKYAEDII